MNNPVKIKQDLVSLIDKVDDLHLLEVAYQLLSNSSNEKELISRLSVDQLDELNYSISESYQKENLISIEDTKISLNRWLKK